MRGPRLICGEQVQRLALTGVFSYYCSKLHNEIFSSGPWSRVIFVDYSNKEDRHPANDNSKQFIRWAG